MRVHIASQEKADSEFFADFLSHAYGVAYDRRDEYDEDSDEEREASIRAAAVVVIVGNGPRCEHAYRIADEAGIPTVVYTPPRTGRTAFIWTSSIDEAARFLLDRSVAHAGAEPEWRPVTADEPKVGEHVSLVLRNRLGQRLGRIDECRRLSDHEWNVDGGHPFTVDGYLADWRPS